PQAEMLGVLLRVEADNLSNYFLYS
ncbi:MAG: hypothetical protein K0R50_4207, partial [Eubacterium sp.]|nr:hypothetical protein [Eubacterium sp.]